MGLSRKDRSIIHYMKRSTHTWSSLAFFEIKLNQKNENASISTITRYRNQSILPFSKRKSRIKHMHTQRLEDLVTTCWHVSFLFFYGPAYPRSIRCGSLLVQCLLVCPTHSTLHWCCLLQMGCFRENRHQEDYIYFCVHQVRSISCV